MKGKEDKYDQYTEKITSSYSEEGSRDECIGISFSTTLKNIKPAFYSQSIGEVLDIKLENINVLKACTDDDQYCGNIVSSYNGAIIKCLKNNRDFGAKILDKSGNILVYNI